MNYILNHPLTLVIANIVIGMIAASVYYRTKMEREGRTRYFRCKDCGREHALDPHGKWMALRTVEEIEAQEKRIKEAQKRFANVPPIEELKPAPHCLHGVPMDKDCPECHVLLVEPQNPRRG